MHDSSGKQISNAWVFAIRLSSSNIVRFHKYRENLSSWCISDSWIKESRKGAQSAVRSEKRPQYRLHSRDHPVGMRDCERNVESFGGLESDGLPEFRILAFGDLSCNRRVRNGRPRC